MARPRLLAAVGAPRPAPPGADRDRGHRADARRSPHPRSACVSAQATPATTPRARPPARPTTCSPKASAGLQRTAPDRRGPSPGRRDARTHQLTSALSSTPGIASVATRSQPDGTQPRSSPTPRPRPRAPRPRAGHPAARPRASADRTPTGARSTSAEHRDAGRLLPRPRQQAAAVHRGRRRARRAAAADRVPLAGNPSPGRRDEPALDRRRRSASSRPFFSEGGSAACSASSQGRSTPSSPCSCSRSCSGSRWTTRFPRLAHPRGMAAKRRDAPPRSARASLIPDASSPPPPRSWSPSSPPSRSAATCPRDVRPRPGQRRLPRRARRPDAAPPAVLQLLGRTTWALPGWLERRLPRVAIEAEPSGPSRSYVPEPALEAS